MSRTSSGTRTRARPIRRAAPPPRHPGAKRPDRAAAIRAWLLLAAGAFGFLLLLWLAIRLLSGGGEEPASPVPTGPAGSTGAKVAPFADPPPQGRVAATFPRPAEGTRLELKVIALGDDPDVCTAEALLIASDERSAYHHGCRSAEDIDRAFFLVLLTNVTSSRVPVAIEGFTVVGADGEVHPALVVPPIGASGTRFFPQQAVLGPGASLKRWVTIDGSDGQRPRRLVYTDGAERLEVRFAGDWV